MRVIKEFRDPRMKISIFTFNEKWIVKIEAGLCEQTYKYPQEEWTLDQVTLRCESEAFRLQIAERFQSMHSEMVQRLALHLRLESEEFVVTGTHAHGFKVDDRF